MIGMQAFSALSVELNSIDFYSLITKLCSSCCMSRQASKQ